MLKRIINAFIILAIAIMLQVGGIVSQAEESCSNCNQDYVEQSEDETPYGGSQGGSYGTIGDRGF